MADGFQRNTRQRTVILEELSRLKSHPTATELYRVVRKRIPRISLGTIYRNLDAMAQAGLVRKIAANGRECRFDGDLSDHLHVTCDNCGRIGDIEGSANTPVPARSKRFAGWRITGHKVEYRGLCPDCRT